MPGPEEQHIRYPKKLADSIQNDQLTSRPEIMQKPAQILKENLLKPQKQKPTRPKKENSNTNRSAIP